MTQQAQTKELLLQALEHERGGVLLYQGALECVIDKALGDEWERYLEQTMNHVETLTMVCEALGLDPDEMTPGRQIVKQNGKSLLIAMKMALAANDPPAAEIVACECVVLAETKDHANWELIGALAQEAPVDQAEILQEAYQRIEDEEDEHLTHSKQWCSELWRRSLGLDATLASASQETSTNTIGDANRRQVPD
jgi:hypothetical protein